MSKRPITVIILSWLYIATGAIGLVYHLSELRMQPFSAEIIWISFVRLLAIVAGIFMLRGADWARWLALAWIAFHVVVGALNSVQQAIIHALFLALFAYFLLRGDARSYFRPQATETTKTI
jgi:hypothetical protein